MEKLICEGTPDLVHEFLAFVAPAPSARLNFRKDLPPRRVPPSKLAIQLASFARRQIASEL